MLLLFIINIYTIIYSKNSFNILHFYSIFVKKTTKRFLLYLVITKLVNSLVNYIICLYFLSAKSPIVS